MWQRCVGLSLVSFASEFFYGATSLGPAIVFNVGWQLCFLCGVGDGTLTQLAVNLTVMETFSAALQMWHLRKQIDPKLALAISLPTATFTAVGQLLMIQVSSQAHGDDWLKRCLGGILFMIALHRVYAIRSKLAAQRRELPPKKEPLMQKHKTDEEILQLGESDPPNYLADGDDSAAAGLDLSKMSVLCSILFW
jgi:uncharacterized membrane protein YfcA